MSCNKKLYKFIACLWQGENEEPEAVAIFYVLSQTKDGMPVWEPQDGRNDLRLKERIEGGDWFTAGFGGFENGKLLVDYEVDIPNIEPKPKGRFICDIPGVRNKKREKPQELQHGWRVELNVQEMELKRE